MSTSDSEIEDNPVPCAAKDYLKEPVVMSWSRVAIALAIFSLLGISGSIRAASQDLLDLEQADAMLSFLELVAAGNKSEAALEAVLRSEGTGLIVAQLNLARRVEPKQYEEILRALMEGRDPAIEPVDDTVAASRGALALRREVWGTLGWGVENTPLLRLRLDALRKLEVRDRAVAVANRYLPRAVELKPSFHVVMGGRAGAAALSQGRLYVDLLALSFGEVRTGEAYLGSEAVVRFFAHEAHHVGLARILEEKRATLALSEHESRVFRMLQTLVQEGAATLLIDWAGDVASQRENSRFREPLAAIEKWLSTVESLASDLLEGKARNDAEFDAATAVMLGDAYHVTGAVVLAAIQKAGGTAAVLNILADPREIFVEYNRARGRASDDLAAGHYFEKDLANRISSIGTPAGMLSRGQAVEDARYLIDAVEQTHPDPYAVYGGRIAFRRQARALLESIPDSGMSVPGLFTHLRPLVSNLADQHSRLAAPDLPQTDVPEKYLPIRFKLAYDGVFVSETKAGHEHLRGSRLLSVDGTPLEELLARMQTIRPAENEFGTMRWLSIHLRTLSRIRELLPGTTGELRLTLDTPEGSAKEALITMLPRDEYSRLDWSPRVDRAGVSTDGMVGHQFLDADKKVAYLWYAAAMTREAFQIGRANQSTAIEDYLSRTYENYLDISLPEDVDEAIQSLPSLTEELVSLLGAMRENDSTHLVIDLRRNGGGWTASTIPLLYLLYGDRYFETELPDRWTFRISPLYLEKFATTLQEFNKSKGTNLRIGDYYFQPGDKEVVNAAQQREEYLGKLRAKKLEFLKHLEPLAGKTTLSPRVVVLVSPRTSSSAYHLMYYLWRLGGTVVGVPPIQAGNAFMDVISARLPNSGLQLDVSSSAVEMFPDDPGMGKTFRPQYPMTWSDFAEYDFDTNSEILYARDLIESGQVN